VNDLADAHLRALEYLFKNKTSNFFNLGSENGYSVREIIAMCEKVSGKKVRYTESPRRPGDPPVLVGDSTKAKQILSWKPQYSLEKIISTAWAWEQNKKY
jgi:UDP-glucose 4-epimerase